MANEYVDKLTALLDRVILKVPRGVSVEVKPFFGGAAVYADGKICISLTKVGLALKLADEDRAQLFGSGKAKPLRYFPKAPIKKRYVLLTSDFLTDHKSVKCWMEKSIALVLSSV